MRWSFIFVCLLCISVVHANLFLTDEAKTIYTSEELEIYMAITGGASISYLNSNAQLRWIQGDINFFPLSTDRQQVLDATYTPAYTSKNDTHIAFRWNRVNDAKVSFTTSYLVETQNQYQKIREKIPFPIRSDLPKDVEQYLEFGKYIDYADDISTTASLIASGKNDLFDVSQAIAYWVYTNIEYDLSTLGQEGESRASQIIINRRGVCNELSILFVSMMRSLGVPARYVSGIAYTNSVQFDEPWVPHAWAEVYFPEYGWVPFDLTYAQFGYVDASHIKFSDSPDVATITTNFIWQSTSDDIRVRLLPTDFDLSVRTSSGSVSDLFSVSLETAYSGVSPGSFTVLKITANNAADHYVSSVLQLSAPKEVLLTDKQIPVFLKPGETKAYYVLLEVTADLSSRYIYEMPLSVYTQNGNEYKTSFAVSESYSSISFDQVNAYLQAFAPSSSNSEELSINCQGLLNKERFSPVTCLIENKGNVFLVGTEICLESSAKVRGACVVVDIPINQAYTFRSELNSSDSSEQLATLSLVRDGKRSTKTFIFPVQDIPSLEIDNISYATDLSLYLKKRSVAIPRDIVIELSTPNKDLFWDIPSLETNAQIAIPFSSYYLDSGANTLQIVVTWNFEGVEYSVSDTIEILYPERSFFERVLRWLFLVFN